MKKINKTVILFCGAMGLVSFAYAAPITLDVKVQNPNGASVINVHNGSCSNLNAGSNLGNFSCSSTPGNLNVFATLKITPEPLSKPPMTLWLHVSNQEVGSVQYIDLYCSTKDGDPHYFIQKHGFILRA